MPEILERLTARQRALLAALVSAALVVYSMPIGTRPLWSQDEARMVLLAEDTVRHGLRLPARVRDVPYLNKPPLFFWTIALAAWPTGRVSDREAPIPSVAAALATLLGVFAIGRRLSGAHTGFIALVVLGHQPGFFFLSHEVLPDMMFAAWLTWALYFLLRALGALPPRRCHLVGFYLCVVGALWTKGPPAMMVIPATIAACLASGGGRRLLGLRPWMGLGLVALDGAAMGHPLCPDAGAREQPGPGGESGRRSGTSTATDDIVDSCRR